MEQFAVTFQPSGVVVAVCRGTSLLSAQIAAGLRPDGPCGGRGTCGKCRVTVDGQEVLACQTPVDRDMTVWLPGEEKIRILTQGIGKQGEPDGTDAYCLALDVGTTTLVAYLFDGKSGALLAQSSALNPQKQYGADVISRIQYTLEQDGQALQTTIRRALADLIRDATHAAGISPWQITATAAVGNTAMHHLLLGISPRSLIVPPYMPAVSEALELPPEGLLPVGGTIRVLPNIAGFVGGDTVGCMTAVGFDRQEDLTLMIDIGTNGEMVLGNKRRRIACSTAAGPAFEGAGISCGMRGAVGAIDHVWLADGKISCHVIGEGKALGLCGSGLLDLVAVLLEAGVLDDSGFLAGGTYQLPGTAVTLTQKDVRQVQLAKAAICAGIRLMAKHLGIRLAQIQQVLLAGAFGNYLDPASACRIGMIPACLLERIQPIGNGAGAGAALCALRRAEFERSKALAETTEFLELAACPDFQDCYVDALELGVCEDDDL